MILKLMPQTTLDYEVFWEYETGLHERGQVRKEDARLSEQVLEERAPFYQIPVLLHCDYWSYYWSRCRIH
jgi:hypothetical protein